ncbi:hypothetical protein, partial [Domibacillus enclensis]|uniref:hypothetical protein n=1 Tax=Domibacillus enclensis TaxID=1017273 RepID=UPI0005F8514E
GGEEKQSVKPKKRIVLIGKKETSPSAFHHVGKAGFILDVTRFSRTAVCYSRCSFRTTTGGGLPVKTPVGRADRLKQTRFLGWFSVRPTGKRNRQTGAPEYAFLES